MLSIILANIVSLLACAADGITTRKFAVKHGRAIELNSWLYGVYPEWPRMIGVYCGEIALWNGLEFLMCGMAFTGHPIWIFAPRAVMACFHGWAAFHNTHYY